MIGKILNVITESNWITFAIMSDGEILKRAIPLDARGYKILLSDLSVLLGKERAARILENDDGLGTDIAEACRGLRVEFATKDSPGKIKIDHFLGVV